MMKSESRKTVFKVDAREHTTKSATGKSMAGFGKATIEMCFYHQKRHSSLSIKCAFFHFVHRRSSGCVCGGEIEVFMWHTREKDFWCLQSTVSHTQPNSYGSATAQSLPPSAACTHTERDNLLKRPLILLAAASAVE